MGGFIRQQNVVILYKIYTVFITLLYTHEIINIQTYRICEK